MTKRTVQGLFAAILVILVISVIVVGNIIEKRTPSKKHISNGELLAIYGLGEDDSDGQAAIILQDSLVEEKALVDNGQVYLEYSFVKANIDDKFYWDNNENVLIYTTPTDIIKADLGSGEYYVSKTKNETDYTIVKVIGSKTYIAMEYIMLYSNVEYSYYENPSRVCIKNEWNVTVNTATLKKGTKIRKSKSIKDDIIHSCDSDVEVTIIEKGSKWSDIMTEDGFFGYVQNASLTKESEKTLTNDYKAPEYNGISLGKTVSLAWHMVTSSAANAQLIDLVTPAKGLNVIAPTWYRLSDSEGNIDSIASADYVSRAHMLGLNVWASVDDQAEGVSDSDIFPYTSKRERIINQLIASAIEYDLDGISLDIEFITADIADDYIEFVRELSVKCRANGIILSICDKMPEPSNRFMNLKAQGEVVDYVILMGYDEHWGPSSGAGSVASLPWVTAGIQTAVDDVDSQKVILAVPFYTRIWTENADGQVVECVTVDMDTAIANLASKGVESVWVDNFGQYYGEYETGDGNVVRIWIEDTRSIEEKLKLISEYEIAGMAAWRLGLENSDLWNTIIKYTSS